MVARQRTRTIRGGNGHSEFDDEITGPVLLEPVAGQRCAGVEHCAVATGTAAPQQAGLKGLPLTVGGLLLLVALAWGGYSALVQMGDRATTRRARAISQHDHDDRAHPGLRRQIEQAERRLGKQLEVVIGELKRIDQALRERERRRARRR